MKSLILSLLAIAFLSAVAMPRAVRAAEDAETDAVTLKVGDPAPPLKVGGWVKGEPVNELEKGNVYVLEYWATWCGPCVQVIPHVTALQEKYKDKKLVVIGMNVWENDDSAVEPFVAKMGDKMNYRVAVDDKSAGAKEGVMAETWMKAAGRRSIPTSMIVDRDLKVMWIGHPMQMAKPLAAVIDGTFDPAKEAARQAKADEAGKSFGQAMRAKDYDKALAVIDDLIATDPDNGAMYRPAKLMVLFTKEDYKAANALAKELSDSDDLKENPQLLLSLANMMLSQESDEVDVALAKTLAEKAVAEGGDMAPLAKSLLAKAHAREGNYGKAVELQTEAVEGVEGRQKQALQQDLDEYKAKAEEAAAPAPAK